MNLRRRRSARLLVTQRLGQRPRRCIVEERGYPLIDGGAALQCASVTYN
jgi:hypothetical protein